MRLPAELRRRGGADTLFGLLGLLGETMPTVAALSGVGRREPRPVERGLPLVVTEVAAAAGDVAVLRLADPASAPLPPWTPGCHVDVRLPSGGLRQYSLCGDPADRSAYRIAVRLVRDGRGGSAEVHALVPGSVVTVSGPRTAFHFTGGGPHLFVAGGIGITPILPMVAEAARRGEEWRLLYLGRSRDSLPFLDELARHGDRVTVRTDDEHGLPGPDLLAAYDGDGNGPQPGFAGGLAAAAVYCCGPAPLLALVREAARDARAFHAERFAPAPVVDGRPFTVKLAGTGRTVEVAADKTMLDALSDAVPSVAYSCRQGFCGTCRVTVLAGGIEHRDRFPERLRRDDEMMPCVSRAEGDHLIIDL
ncbi:PDR/VanB family oxidoreductase [Actinocorallia sp. API 0066]|uniref:PDR/VanB family oxidoreductase n=1 Tax=Actinocorallia sp. API 0066 TaxID=2896846 RepID=UPI001E2DA0BA|nr:PDR/VanB family oxidoreductase [Actinocorallia sp. API 0066]MCD0450037.1 PDR/VanB family oxidoreductase [Actinocorallia sp. API 0066]